MATALNGSVVGKGDDANSNMYLTKDDAIEGGVFDCVVTWTYDCPQCGGPGVFQNRKCDQCGGRGYTEKANKYEMVIPAKSRHGQQLRLAGQGFPGIKKGDPSGDLYVHICVIGVGETGKKAATRITPKADGSPLGLTNTSSRALPSPRR